MFCGECGAKLKKGDMFCGECGAKVEHQEEVKKTVKKETTSSIPNPKKPMDKKTKIIIGAVAVVAVALFGLYQMFSSMYSPKSVAKDYVDALMKKDASKLYSYLEIDGDKTFVTKKSFEKILENDSYSVDIENYTITKVEYATGKLSATVTVSYTTKSSSSEKTKTISLTKSKDKKLLFFDDWKVADLSAESMTVKDYEITVPKDAEVTFASIKVDKKYLDKEESTETLDVYVLPQVFSAKTEIKAKLSNGMELSNEVTPSSYYDYYKLSINLDNLSKSAKETLTKVFQKDIKAIYQAGIERKTWDDIKSTYTKDKVDTSDLEETYTEFVSNLSEASSVLKTIDFTKVELSSLSLNDDGNLVVRAKVNYKYTVEYTPYGGEATTKDSTSYSYITFTYQIVGKDYSLIDAKNLTTYFSRY